MKDLYKKCVLIVDDVASNRIILRDIFDSDYAVLEAQNGEEALELLRRENDRICVMIIALSLPGVDGYEVLKIMREDETLLPVPIIISADKEKVESQIMALELGADDFIIKPFIPSIVRRRVLNIITRTEALRTVEENRYRMKLLRFFEIDAKTGIYTKGQFCSVTSEKLLLHPEKRYIIIRWDVDHFKLYNDAYGTVSGDNYLSKIGEMYRTKINGMKHILTYGRWEADHFVMCCEKDGLDLEGLFSMIRGYIAENFPDYEFVPRFGIFEIDNPRLDVNLMCDRAYLALKTLKDSFEEYYAYYNGTMLEILIEEQKLIREMKDAIGNEEFEVYFQPQVNYYTGELSGAEALVRWNHPTKGLVQPDQFIPIFERNGAIRQLDEFVLHKICTLLRQWQDEGINISPISVNISRKDIYNPLLCSRIRKIISYYDISPEMLHIEITESAYIEDSEQIIKVVEEFKKDGFTVEMDDFGTGYSSLNFLKDVPVDTVKLDMRFISRGNSSRGGNILSSVVRMAHSMQMEVIAEGVETRQQADYLKSIGCKLMQGYFFAKPMLPESFRSLLKNNAPLVHHSGANAAETRNIMDFLDSSVQSTLLFDSFIGGAAIVEFDGNRLELIRANDRYFKIMKTNSEDYFGDSEIHFINISDDTRDDFISILFETVKTGEEVECEIKRKSNTTEKPLWLHVRARCLSSNKNHHVIYLLIEDITEQRLAKNKDEKLVEAYSVLTNNVPGGMVTIVHNGEHNTVSFNQRTAQMFGYSVKEYGDMIEKDVLTPVHPDDRLRLQNEFMHLKENKAGNFSTHFRHKRKEGGWTRVQFIGEMISGGADTLVSAIIMDAERTELEEKQNGDLEMHSMLLNCLYDELLCGMMLYKKEKNGLKLIRYNMASVSMLGYSDEKLFVQERSSGDGDMEFDEAVQYAFDTVQKVSYEHEVERVSGEKTWIMEVLYPVPFVEDSGLVQRVMYDITAIRVLSGAENKNVSRVEGLKLTGGDNKIAQLVGPIQNAKLINAKDQTAPVEEKDRVTRILTGESAAGIIQNHLKERPKDGFDALLILDLDGFGFVNETLGRVAGDILLGKVALTLKKLFRKDDIVARYKDDQFLVYMRNAMSMECVMKKARAVISALSEIDIVDVGSVQCCVGAVGLRNEDTSVDFLLDNARAALREAKKMGKNCCAAFPN